MNDFQPSQEVKDFLASADAIEKKYKQNKRRELLERDKTVYERRCCNCDSKVFITKAESQLCDNCQRLLTDDQKKESELRAGMRDRAENYARWNKPLATWKPL